MNGDNVTFIFFLAFPDVHNFKPPLFLALLVTYMITFFGNAIIIMLVITNGSLHSPMYFFITQVSLCDLLVTTVIFPNVFSILVYDGFAILLESCFAQLFFFSLSEASECLLLTVMSYDRYVAICQPLHYRSTVTQMFCVVSVSMCWMLSFVMSLLHCVAVTHLIFCSSNTVNHFFCDLEPLLELSCSDTFAVSLQVMLFGAFVLVFPATVIVTSYVNIILAIWAISSTSGRQKAFSTCSSHLTVVNMFYGTLILVYVVPSYEKLRLIKRMLSLCYTMVLPLLNPILYSFRNKDIKESLGKTKLNIRRILCDIFQTNYTAQSLKL